MKAIMRSFFSIAATAVLALLLTGFTATHALADSGQRDYAFLIGAGFLCGLNPTFCPTVAMAENGEVIEFTGTGMFSIHSKSASGAGNFIHKNAGGHVLASGTWTAVDLLSFHSFGSAAAQGLPANFEGGKALLRVRLSPHASGALDAILRITCDLGDQIPAASEEGIRVNVPGWNNFSE